MSAAVGISQPGVWTWPLGQLTGAAAAAKAPILPVESLPPARATFRASGVFHIGSSGAPVPALTVEPAPALGRGDVEQLADDLPGFGLRLTGAVLSPVALPRPASAGHFPRRAQRSLPGFFVWRL